MTDDQADGGPATPTDGSPAPAGFTRNGRGPRRRTRWDRPPDPKDWRFFVGWLGRILITLGLVMFLFVAYQLWGTGIETARAQNRLEDQFEELVAATGGPAPVATTVPVPATTVPATSVPGSPPVAPSTIPVTAPPTAPPTTAAPEPTVPVAVPAEQQNLPPVERGRALARIAIPAIGVDKIVVPGVTHNDLKDGPGHFPDTPLPGQLGNSAIAGHRTTYGAPFRQLDELAVGHEIEITLPNGQTFVYVVTGTEVVMPSDYHVISDSDPTRATLTLITCTPEFESTERLVVYSELDPTRSGQVGEPTYYDLGDEPADVEVLAPTVDDPTITAPLGTAPPGTDPAATTPATTPAGDSPPEAPGGFLDAPVAQETDAFSEGWFHDSDAWPQLILWSLALALIVAAGWWLARFYRREWAGALAALVPFVVCLYFFFQNVNRLLPAGL